MQVLVNGITNGLQFALLGVALALVYRTTRVLHLALGGVAALTPFAASMLCSLRLPFLAAGFIAALAAGALSLTIGVLNHARLERRGASEAAHVVSSLGILIALTQGISFCWSDRVRVLPIRLNAGLTVLGVTVSNSQLFGSLLALALLLAYLILLRGTRLGWELQAVAEDATGVALLGTSVGRVRNAAYLLSGGFAATGALSIASESGFDARRGLGLMVFAMSAMIVGGPGLSWRPAAGGLVLGLVREFVSAWAGARWKEPVTFALIVVALLLRRRQLETGVFDPGLGR